MTRDDRQRQAGNLEPLMPRQRAFGRRLDELPPTFWWLWAGTLLSALATFVWPFLALYLTARGFSPARTGLISSFCGAGIVIGGPIAGVCADRFGRRPAMLAALSGAASSAAVLAALSSPLAIGLVMLLFGVSSAALSTTMQATVADVVPPESRPHAFGLLYWANNVGIGVSLVVGGLLASVTWTLPFLADASTTLLFALLMWWRLPETRPPTGRVPSGSGKRVGYGLVLRDHRFAAFLLLNVLFGVVFWQMLTALPIDMARHGASAAAFGPVLAVNTALIAAVQPFAGRVTGRCSRTTALTGASVLVALGFGAYSLCTRPWQYALATAVWSLGEIGYMPVAASLVTDLAPADLRGRYSGAYGLTAGTAGFVAPLVGPAIMQAFGSRVLWTACLGAGLAVAAGFVTLGRTSREFRVSAGTAARPAVYEDTGTAR